MPRPCTLLDLGRLPYAEALAIQQRIAEDLKQNRTEDHLLFVEHSHVITIGRNGHDENILAPASLLARAGIELHTSDRGGDVTYHGPGQIVGYPILDLRNWKRDVGAYARAIEQLLIDTLEEFGIEAKRIPKLTGVWVDVGGEPAKIAALGIHLSRWVSTHGWALNVSTDLRCFDYIVPCGLTKPVTSMERLGVRADAERVKQTLARHFARIFDFELRAAPHSAEPVLTGDFA
jgi:lipoyl(octanoyl) transferase